MSSTGGRAGAADSLLVSYLALRKGIGAIGIALPFVLAFGKRLAGDPGIEPSVSDYYYTVMRDVLVGSLCAIAVFLFSYRGYEPADNRAAMLASVCAAGVALCPTTPAAGATPAERAVGALHVAFAAVFFLTLAYFSLCLFRKTGKDRPPTPRKLQRNRVYTACGVTILACLALAAAAALVAPASPITQLDPVFWLEATAVVAFGVSWLTKGEAILADLPAPGTSAS